MWGTGSSAGWTTNEKVYGLSMCAGSKACPQPESMHLKVQGTGGRLKYDPVSGVIEAKRGAAVSMSYALNKRWRTVGSKSIEIINSIFFGETLVSDVCHHCFKGEK